MPTNISVYNFGDRCYKITFCQGDPGKNNGRVTICLGDLEIDLWEGKKHNIRELCELLALPLRQLQGEEQFADIS